MDNNQNMFGTGMPTNNNNMNTNTNPSNSVNPFVVNNQVPPMGMPSQVTQAPPVANNMQQPVTQMPPTNNPFDVSNSVIPNATNTDSTQNVINTQDTINPFVNNQANNNIVNEGYQAMLKQEGINVHGNQSRFINTGYNETAITDLNISEDYNNLNKIDYTKDPKVMENIQQFEGKKNTIPISKELKMIFMIAIGLFVFILIMPYIFDLFIN